MLGKLPRRLEQYVKVLLSFGMKTNDLLYSTYYYISARGRNDVAVFLDLGQVHEIPTLFNLPPLYWNNN